MNAVLRVKRKSTNAPLDKLVISCKRLKSSSEISSDTSSVLQFAGTFTDPTEDVTKHVAKILDTENHKVGVKRESDSDYPASISGKLSKWIHVNSVTKKRKITDCQHSQGTSNEEFKDKWMTFIDIEDCWSSTNQDTKEKEDIEDYVYDLYYAQTSDDIWFDDILVLRPEYSKLPDVEFQSEDDSEDSNAESHWKNDYPDTDPDHSFEDSDDLVESDSSDDFLDHYSIKRELEYQIMRKECIYMYPPETESSDSEENETS